MMLWPAIRGAKGGKKGGGGDGGGGDGDGGWGGGEGGGGEGDGGGGEGGGHGGGGDGDGGGGNGGGDGGGGDGDGGGGDGGEVEPRTNSPKETKKSVRANESKEGYESAARTVRFCNQSIAVGVIVEASASAE